MCISIFLLLQKHFYFIKNYMHIFALSELIVWNTKFKSVFYKSINKYISKQGSRSRINITNTNAVKSHENELINCKWSGY